MIQPKSKVGSIFTDSFPTTRLIEEMIWDGLHFAQHLRSERLGEFTIGNDLHRSESLALIQLLILYHLFTATATAALDGLGTPASEVAPAA